MIGHPLLVIDRESRKQEEEKVYGQKALNLLYGGGPFGTFIKFLASRLPFVSAFYGWLQKRPSSKKKIIPFIKLFDVNTDDFLKKIAEFTSFNDFFIRKLKPSARPIQGDEKIAICPADARYRFYPNLKENEGFWLKGEKFDLITFLKDEKLSAEYDEGTLVLARLCPSDYHRYHFPVSGTPSLPEVINGWLYSVNPIALKQDIHIFTKNKRVVTQIETSSFGKVVIVEIGATNVGSIHQTFTPHSPVKKGDEKGYFEFGASAVALLFKKNSIQLDEDLLALTQFGLEIKCLMGQSLGRSLK